MDHTARVKCCVIGDFAVGKTSLIYSWLKQPTKDVQSTLGIDFFTKMAYVGQTAIRVSLWDTAGAERFRSLMYSYLRDAQVILVVYDRTKPDAMQTVTRWMRVVEQHEPTVVGVIGNKSDLTVLQHDLADTLEPYRRMRWQIVTSHVSSRNPETFSNVIHKCLELACPTEEKRPQRTSTVRFQRRSDRHRTCCT